MNTATQPAPASSVRKIKDGFTGQRMIVLPPTVRRTVARADLIRGLYLTAIGFYPNAGLALKPARDGKTL